MTDQGLPDACSRRRRLILLRALGEVLVRRAISIQSAARLLDVNHRTFDDLMSGCIGGFTEDRLKGFRITIETLDLDIFDNPKE